MIDIDDGLVVCSENIKRYLISLIDKQDKLVNLTFLTIDELRKKLFFDFKKRALYAVSKEYKVKVPVAKTYINNLIYINNAQGSNDKLEFLKEIKKFLADNDLVIYHNGFDNFLKSNVVTFIGYEKTHELDYIIGVINKYTKTKVLDIFKNNSQPLVYSFSDINNEVNYVFESISKLLENNVNFDKIKIANLTADYSFVVNRVSHSYNIKVIDNSNSSMLNSDNALDIIETIFNYDNFYDALIAVSNQNVRITNAIVNIINDYEAYDLLPIDFKDILLYELTNKSFEIPKFDKSIEIIEFNESFYEEDVYIFYLGFNHDALRILKDEDYLSDDIKKQLGINTSLDKNLEFKQGFTKRIKHYKNLVMTFTKNLTFKETIQSNLISELGLSVQIVEDDIYLNETETKLSLGKLLDDYFMFGQESNLLKTYYYNDFKYKSFDFNYKVIDNEIYATNKDKVVTLSYTSLDEFCKCKFKYYVNKVLRIDSFEDSLQTRLGTFAHEILRHYDEAKEENLNDAIDKGLMKALNNKEIFYYKKVADMLKHVISFNKKYEGNSMLTHTLSEQEISLSFFDGNLVFKGFIDKMMYGEVDNETLVAIFDFKTGNLVKVPRKNKPKEGSDGSNEDALVADDLNKVKPTNNQLNLQLMSYLYLITKSNLFHNVKVVGLYLQKIGPIKFKKGKLPIEKQLQDHLKLEGYSIEDVNYMNNFNKMFASGYIKAMSLNKDGSFSHHAKVLGDEDMDLEINKMDDLIKNAYLGIEKAEFSINPTKESDNDNSCLFCKYNDICFKPGGYFTNYSDEEKLVDVD